ncbi:MAG: CHAP domain-containing protein [Gemmobacter sp.]
MIRTIRAAWCLVLAAALLAALMPDAAMATPSRRTEPQAERDAVLVAVAEAKRMRAKGQRVWCVPFARTASGVAIKGNAKTWWAAAKGLYDRGATPQEGAVMVFAGNSKMPMGHVAVVAELVDDRTILVDHANWKRNQVSLGMAVVDVSQAGDWSAVRVEGDPGVMGRVNPVSGFIYPEGPEAQQVAATTPARAPVVNDR